MYKNGNDTSGITTTFENGVFTKVREESFCNPQQVMYKYDDVIAGTIKQSQTRNEVFTNPEEEEFRKGRSLMTSSPNTSKEKNVSMSPPSISGNRFAEMSAASRKSDVIIKTLDDEESFSNRYVNSVLNIFRKDHEEEENRMSVDWKLYNLLVDRDNLTSQDIDT